MSVQPPRDENDAETERLRAMFSGGNSSTIVHIWLVLDGQKVKACQLSRDWVYLDKPFDYPPCSAELILSVDGKERRWDVNLPEGISADNHEVALKKKR